RSAGVPGRPGGLGGVGVADEPEPAVGHAADIRPVYRAEGEERLVPGGTLIRRVAGGLGADRVIRVFIGVGLPVDADGGCLVLPFLPAGRIAGQRAEGLDRPRGRVLGGVLSDALLAVVHHDRDLGQVGVAVRIGQLGHAARPWALRLGLHGVHTLPEPGVEDAGDIPGAGQVTGFDGRTDYLGGVQT